MEPTDSWVVLLIIACSRQAFVATHSFVVLQEGAWFLKVGTVLLWIPEYLGVFFQYHGPSIGRVLTIHRQFILNLAITVELTNLPVTERSGNKSPSKMQS